MIYKISVEKNENEKVIKNEKVKRVTPAEIGLLEEHIENYIAYNIGEVLPTTNLMPIFQERKRQEEPDIMAVNENGDLYIFELKRFTSNEENLLQLLRYAQKYGNCDYENLNKKYLNYTGKMNEETNLLEGIRNYFGVEKEGKQINKKQHLFLVTNGIDEKTIEKIKFWEKNGLKVNIIVYWIFSIGDEYYIEFNVCHDLKALIEYEEKYYIVNTNSTHSKTTTSEDLIREKKVAIQGGIKHLINKFNKKDRIYLYKNGVGIIATGTIKTGIKQEMDWNGLKNEEWYMELDDFQDLSSNPISATQLKEICNKNFFFATTLNYLDKDSNDLILDAIKKINV